VCLGVYYNLSIWYKLSNQTNKGAMISLIGAGITIVLNIWWVPVFGYTGSAWATFICYFSMMVICYLMGAKYYPIPYHTKRIASYTLLALLLFFIAWLVRDHVHPVAMYMISSLLFGVFGVAVYLFVRKDKMLTSPN
jgi:O-antigen/teichoic acid export membrane protein